MEYANNSITVFNEPISEKYYFSPFMMSAFDNMKARREICLRFGNKVLKFLIIILFL